MTDNEIIRTGKNVIRIEAEAVANLASRPYGRFGRWRRKRTHIKLVAKELKKKTKQKQTEKKK